MFTGLDIIVVVLMIWAFLYATSPSRDTQVTFEPLTFLVVLFITAMVVVSLS